METALTNNQPVFTQKEIRPSYFSAFVKLVYFFGFTCFFLVGAIYLTKEIINQKAVSKPNEILLVTNYQNVLWQDFGEVFEPLIKLPIYYPQYGYKNEEFLLDSGAVVSSLPREKASELGFSLAKLPRSTFAGFGGTTSFAYKADLNVFLGNNQVAIPVVFTEAAGTKPILGRSGFFEKYSIYFNSKAKKVEILR